MMLKKCAQKETFLIEYVLASVIAQDFGGVIGEFGGMSFGVIGNSKISGLASEMAAQTHSNAILLRLAHPDIDEA